MLGKISAVYERVYGDTAVYCTDFGQTRLFMRLKGCPLVFDQCIP